MLNQLAKTVEEGQQATEKMNQIADNLILARNVVVYSMAFYASYTIFRNFFV